MPSPWSIHEQIRKLDPGSYITLPEELLSRRQDIDSQRAGAQTEWSAVGAAKKCRLSPFEGTEETATDKLENFLSHAAKIRMISDVPLGALLSGGTDSSTVVSLMRAQSLNPVKTFSLGFDDKVNNESERRRSA